MTVESLDGRIALVVGASSGVGYATSLTLAAAGAQVIAVARREEALARLVDHAPSIVVAPLDATDRRAVDERIAAIAQRWGRLDLVVFATGVNIPRRRLADLSLADWQSLQDTNVTAAFHVLQASLLLLRAAQGLCIFINSVSGRWPDQSGAAYQASKRALLGLAHAAALEESTIRVSSILPGLIDTPLLEFRPVVPPAEERALALHADDIAQTCLFLATLHPRAYIPELVVMPTALQRIGRP